MPLPMPKVPWTHISIVFMLGLQGIHCDFDSAFMMVDHFSKMAHFIASTNGCIFQYMTILLKDGIATWSSNFNHLRLGPQV